MVEPETESPRNAGRRAVREILVYGLAGGLLIAVLRLIETRFLVGGGSFEIYGGLIALLFAGLGIWLGLSLRRTRPALAVEESAPGGEFVRDDRRLDELGITPRELEILELVAAGLSNRQIAARLFVSQNTVKTHVRRLFEKLGAERRTQAVRIAAANRLIPSVPSAPSGRPKG